jgi:hypothetical protein
MDTAAIGINTQAVGDPHDAAMIGQTLSDPLV